MQRTEPVFAVARGRDFDAFETSPRRGRRADLVALGIAIIAVGAIIANALFMQSGPHPSPIFVNKTDKAALPPKPAKLAAAAPQAAVPTAPVPVAVGNVQLPRPRPVEAQPVKAEAPAVVKTTATNAVAPRADPIGELIAPSPSKRITAVQRALADYGYGQIKPSGILDRETQSAIEDFERGKKMPVTGQISPRLMKELSALSGRPLE